MKLDVSPFFLVLATLIFLTGVVATALERTEVGTNLYALACFALLAGAVDP